MMMLSSGFSEEAGGQGLRMLSSASESASESAETELATISVSEPLGDSIAPTSGRDLHNIALCLYLVCYKGTKV